MDTLVLNTKRKKRKTRKCLDELRKRSRKICVPESSSNSIAPEPCRVSKISGVKQQSNCITSKRLTLTMFAKAVRSETITRPLIRDTKTNPILNLNLKSPIMSPLNIMVDSKSSSESTHRICNESDIQRSDFEKLQHDSEISSEGMILFSPMQRQEMHSLKESANEETVSTLTSTSGSVEDFGYHLYEKLIEDIPLYLRRNFPSLTKDDVIDKTKRRLQNIYFDNLQKQYENYNPCNEPQIKLNGLTSDISCTSNEIIVHPMDYIKIGWRQSYQQSCHESSPPNADVSPHALCSQIASPQLHSAVPYTPDYEYYPHRLNE